MSAVRAAGLVIALLAASLAEAGQPTVTVLPGSFDRVWRATLDVLQREGWGIDDTTRPVGLILTKSERIQGPYHPLVGTTKRVRLRVVLTPVDATRTGVSIEHELFVRERQLWVELDRSILDADPLAHRDRPRARALLGAIREAL